MRFLLLEAPGLMKIERSAQHQNEMAIHLNSSRIVSDGLKLVDKYLLRLHVYRSTADAGSGVPMYEKMTQVDGNFGDLRKIVLRHKSPPKQIVQPNTVERGGKIILEEYEATHQGLIQSWAERGV